MPEVSPARQAALGALTLWREGMEGGGGAARAEEVLSATLSASGMDRRDRALAHELFYGAVRNLIRLDHTIPRFIKRKYSDVDPVVKDVLRIAVYQIIFLDRVPSHAAVNEAVEQTKAARGAGAASFVNGVLRSMLRAGPDGLEPDLTGDPAERLSVMHSFPRWLARRWTGRYGPEGADALMAASNAVPPLTLRVNTLRTTRQELSSLMSGAGIVTEDARYSPDGLVVRTGTAVETLTGYADGLFSVQDEAAQLVALLLGPEPGDRVFDACAAPGGKALHIYALSGGKASVLAADIGLDKSRLMKENIARLDAIGVHAAVMDASLQLPLKGGFDRVLLDAPCSALGIIRRRPEVRYVRREADIPRLSKLQSAMLDNVSGVLKPGGVLVYSTCTTEPEEGEFVVNEFLARHGDFVVENAGGFLPGSASEMVTGEGYMRSLPHLHGTDGFFAARLRRKD